MPDPVTLPNPAAPPVTWLSDDLLGNIGGMLGPWIFESRSVCKLFNLVLTPLIGHHEKAMLLIMQQKYLDVHRHWGVWGSLDAVRKLKESGIPAVYGRALQCAAHFVDLLIVEWVTADPIDKYWPRLKKALLEYNDVLPLNMPVRSHTEVFSHNPDLDDCTLLSEACMGTNLNAVRALLSIHGVDKHVCVTPLQCAYTQTCRMGGIICDPDQHLIAPDDVEGSMLALGECMTLLGDECVDVWMKKALNHLMDTDPTWDCETVLANVDPKTYDMIPPLPNQLFEKCMQMARFSRRCFVFIGRVQGQSHRVIKNIWRARFARNVWLAVAARNSSAVYLS